MWMLNMIQGQDEYWPINLDKKIRGYLKLFLRKLEVSPFFVFIIVNIKVNYVYNNKHKHQKSEDAKIPPF